MMGHVSVTLFHSERAGTDVRIALSERPLCIASSSVQLCSVLFCVLVSENVQYSLPLGFHLCRQQQIK